MEFQIKKATSSQYEQVVSIIQNVLQTMPNQEWFAADGADYTREILVAGKGTAYLAICQETSEIAGVFMTVVPGSSSDNLGLDAGLSGEELTKVVHMDTAAVLPAYRGHQLQRRLMLFAEEELKSAGYHYLCCTIHPENKYSLNSAVSLGYEVKTICEKYGGYLRAVLMKEI